MTWAVTANVFTDEPSHTAKAAEVPGRAIAGLALEGIDASMNVHQLEDEDED